MLYPTIRASHTGNSIIESKLGEVASLVGGVEDLVVEDREVEGQAETDGVGRSKVRGSNFGSSLVGLEGSISSTLAVVANSELSKVTVVVTLPIGVRKDRLEPIITLGGIVLSKTIKTGAETHILW